MTSAGLALAMCSALTWPRERQGGERRVARGDGHGEGGRNNRGGAAGLRVEKMFQKLKKKKKKKRKKAGSHSLTFMTGQR